MGRIYAAIFCLIGLPNALPAGQQAIVGEPPSRSQRMMEWTIESKKAYADPFNDVDVDVIFSKGDQSWRVPTFWRGGQRWTVRFAPPVPGEYAYRLESTDANNPDLNGHGGRVNIDAYAGGNALLRHGMLRVSANRRYFEHADGTPFYWLGDTWWTGLSDRLSWDGFQKLTADRKAKGFTAVQFVAGLIPNIEERSPVDPGFGNEGGAVWDPQFRRINPGYFDYADRRVQHLLDAGIAPVIVGAWSGNLAKMGVAKLKQHWRYIIARYGAYPVFWIVGGEVFDPPVEVMQKKLDTKMRGGWSEVARYLRATDPYHHPVSVHEVSPDDLPLQDESLTDFKFFQPSHFGWDSIGVEVAQVTAHYSRKTVTKPLVVAEIGYEGLGGTHLEDFQRVAFWLAMLNGAAGHSYGANGLWEAYTADKLFHRLKWSLMSWEEGMKLPGSYQVGLGATLLRTYPWWRFTPHPEWIAPHGTTFFEPRGDALNRFHMDLSAEWKWAAVAYGSSVGEWTARNGNFRLPYAAGIPGEVRLIYLPSFGLIPPAPPTIFALEEGVRYRAYYWEPASGAKIDLGAVARPLPGPTIRKDDFSKTKKNAWIDRIGNSARDGRTLVAPEKSLIVASGVSGTNLVAAVDAQGAAQAALVLRYQDADNYLAAVYAPKDRTLYLVERKQGVDGDALARTPVAADPGGTVRLTAEVRDGAAIASLSDGRHSSTTPIVKITRLGAGGVGLMHAEDGGTQRFDNFELRQSPVLVKDDRLDRTVYDARGVYRGELKGDAIPETAQLGVFGWDDYATHKTILLDAYLPERLPMSGDWLLVLERRE